MSDGSFRDFALGIGASGPWVTAHVGGRLADLPPRYRDDRVAGAVARAMRYLDGATWSYNEHAPADADTIAHALILAGAIGLRGRQAAPHAGAPHRRHGYNDDQCRSTKRPRSVVTAHDRSVP